jgi:hypothetical protein
MMDRLGNFAVGHGRTDQFTVAQRVHVCTSTVFDEVSGRSRDGLITKQPYIRNFHYVSCNKTCKGSVTFHPVPAFTFTSGEITDQTDCSISKYDESYGQPRPYAM